MSIFNAFKAVQNALKVLTVTEGVIEIADSDAETPDDAQVARARQRLSGEPSGTAEYKENEMSEKNESGTIIEEFELEAKYLVKRVKELLHEGNIRKLVVKDSKGKYLLEVPLTMGVVAGGVLIAYAPVMTALSVLAGAMTNVKIEIVRTVDEDDGDSGEGEGAEDASAEGDADDA